MPYWRGLVENVKREYDMDEETATENVIVFGG
jgi:hypothetical protein